MFYFYVTAFPIEKSELCGKYNMTYMIYNLDKKGYSMLHSLTMDGSLLKHDKIYSMSSSHDVWVTDNAIYASH